MHWWCALTFRRQMHHFLSFKIFHRILSWNSIKQQLCIFIDGIQWTVLGRVIMMQVGRDWEPLPGQQVVISDNTGGRLETIYYWDSWQTQTKCFLRLTQPSPTHTGGACPHPAQVTLHNKVWEGFSYSDKGWVNSDKCTMAICTWAIVNCYVGKCTNLSVQREVGSLVNKSDTWKLTICKKKCTKCDRWNEDRHLDIC